jgi:hypothetical protein
LIEVGIRSNRDQNATWIKLFNPPSQAPEQSAIGDKPFTLSLGLRTSISPNQHIVVGGKIIQRALYLTEPDHRYNSRWVSPLPQ